MQDVEYVKAQLEQNNYSLLPPSETVGPVYKVSAHGNLEADGFDVSFLFIPPGSSVLKHESGTFVERYRFVLGNTEKPDGTIWKVGGVHAIKAGSENAIVEVVRMNRKYDPELPRMGYGDVLRIAEHLDSEAREMVISKMPKTYNPGDLFVIANAHDFGLVYIKPVLNIKQERTGKSYCYDFLDDSLVSSISDEELGKCITLARLINDTRATVPSRNLSKKEVLKIWCDLVPEMVNYRPVSEADNHLVYEPTQVKFMGADGQIKVRVNSLFIVKDSQGLNKLCICGPDHTFRNYSFSHLEDAGDFTLGQRENDEQLLRLSDAAKAIGIDFPDLCPPEQVCMIWADVTCALKDFTFQEEITGPCAPYSRQFTYKGTPR